MGPAELEDVVGSWSGAGSGRRPRGPDRREQRRRFGRPLLSAPGTALSYPDGHPQARRGALPSSARRMPDPGRDETVAHRLRRSGSHESTDATERALRQAAAERERRETHAGSIWRSGKGVLHAFRSARPSGLAHQWRRMSARSSSVPSMPLPGWAATRVRTFLRLCPNSSTWTKARTSIRRGRRTRQGVQMPRTSGCRS